MFQILMTLIKIYYFIIKKTGKQITDLDESIELCLTPRL
jgi:hypothetical protein